MPDQNYHEREAAYRAAAGLNQSALKSFAEHGPHRHNWLASQPDESTAAQKEGVAVERLIAHGMDLAAAKVWFVSRRSNADKATAEQLEADGWVVLSEGARADVIGAAEFVASLGLVDCYRACQPLFAGDRKGLFDYLDVETGDALDIKLTGKPLTVRNVEQSIADQRWHWQDAWYRRLFRDVYGRELRFRFVVVSSVAPFDHWVIELGQKDQELADTELAEVEAAYRACVASGRWPRREQPSRIGLPRWYTPFAAKERSGREVDADLEAALSAAAASIDAGDDLPGGGW